MIVNQRAIIERYTVIDNQKAITVTDWTVYSGSQYVVLDRYIVTANQ